MADINSIKRIKKELSKNLGSFFYVVDNLSLEDKHYYPLYISCAHMLNLIEQLDLLITEDGVSNEIH